MQLTHAALLHTEITHANCGVIVEPGDAQALVDGIEVAKASNTDELGKNGFDYAQSVLSQETAYKAYVGWVESLQA